MADTGTVLTSQGLAGRERRHVTLRTLWTLVALRAGPRRRDEIISFVTERLGAGAYGTDPRYAFRRDLACLRACDFALRFHRVDGTYTLEAAPIALDLPPEELAALALLRGALPEGLPHRPAALALLDRLAAAVSTDQRRLIERPPPFRATLELAQPVGPDEAMVRTLETAIRRRVDVEFAYRASGTSSGPTEAASVVDDRADRSRLDLASGGDADRWHDLQQPPPGSVRRHVAPQEVVLREGHCYLVAFRLPWRSHDAPIHYRIDRIAPGSVRLGSQVLPPGFPEPRAYELRYRLAPTIARGGVSVRFPGQQIAPQPDGSVLVSAKITNLFWARRKLLAYGEHCEVLAPPELRAEMATTARAMAATYAEK